MQGDPILKTRTYTDTNGDRLKLTVTGGLHFIRSNGKPYFSLTCDQRRNGREDCGGADHDLILAQFPELADLAAMHLSNIDGEPLHAIANGWYHLAGAFPDAFGERYHSGNSDRHFPITPPEGKPWQNTEYRKPTGDECVAIFADYVRIDMTEANAIRDKVNAAAMASRHSRNAVARSTLAEIIETMRPRWKAEADACIAKHQLQVYGDAWPIAA